MTAFQLQTFVPQDGKLSITLPVHLREVDVEVSISKRETDMPSKLSDEEYIDFMNSFRGTLRNVDYSDLREKTDREL
jgi:hypothetical protein